MADKPRGDFEDGWGDAPCELDPVPWALLLFRSLKGNIRIRLFACDCSSIENVESAGERGDLTQQSVWQ